MLVGIAVSPSMLVALGFGVSMGAATPIVAAVSMVLVVGAASVMAVGAVIPVVSVIVTGALPVWVVALTPLLLFVFGELDPQALNTSASKISIPKRLRFIVIPSIAYISSNNMYYFRYYRVLFRQEGI
jgi:hypothetical protein